jgi:hypothetical protein
LKIEAISRGRDLFAQKYRPPVAEHGEMPILMSGISLRDRNRPVREEIACEDRSGLIVIEPTQIQAKRVP